MRQDDFKVIEKIGQGAYGEVFLASVRETSKVCVLKCICMASLSLGEQKIAEDEARILSRLHHRHIIEFTGVFMDANCRLNIAMEFADRLTLAHRIREQRIPFEENYIWKVLLQLSSALLYVHQNHVLHRDIKSSNVFLCTDPLDGSDMVKLGDFGVSNSVLDASNLARTIVGTPYSLSPEICFNRPYGEKSDVWALGVLLYELCTLKRPFDATNPGSLVLQIICGQYIGIGEPYSGDLVFVSDWCLKRDATHRPTILQLLTHPVAVIKATDLQLELTLDPDTEQWTRTTHDMPSPTSLPIPVPPPEAFPPKNTALPVFNRHAIETRKPGALLPSRRVRSKKTSTPKATPPPPAVHELSLSRVPKPPEQTGHRTISRAGFFPRGDRNHSISCSLLPDDAEPKLQSAQPLRGREIQGQHRRQWQRPEGKLDFPEVACDLEQTAGFRQDERSDADYLMTGSSINHDSLGQQNTLFSDVDLKDKTGDCSLPGEACESEDPSVSSACCQDAPEPTLSLSQLRAELEEVRAKGEALIGAEAFLDIYRLISTLQCSAAYIEEYVEDRLLGMDFSANTKAASVFCVYRLLALESATDPSNEPSLVNQITDHLDL